MTDYFIYLLQVSGCFALLYACYYGFLRHLTFHWINRGILLSLLPLSFLLPLLDWPSALQPEVQLEIPVLDRFIPLEEVTVNETVSPVATSSTGQGFFFYLSLLYFIGLGLSLLRLLMIFVRVGRLKQQSKTIREGDYAFVLADVPTIFSCFRWIFIPQQKWKAYPSPIIEHEKAHVRLRHSLDLILTELYIALFWFNPFAYTFRQSIRAIHEYQADQAVLGKNIQTSHYLALLLNQLESEQAVQLYSYFNYPILKKRIHMMTTNRSTPNHKWRYLLLIPVLSLLSMALNTDRYSEAEATSSLPHYDHTKLQYHPFAVFPIKNGSTEDISFHYGKTFKRPAQLKSKVHGGIDIRAKIGTPVLATSAGTIAKASMEDRWGNLIVITHPDGFETWYAHLNGFEIEKGESVSTGQVIGYVGNTGLSTGPHLHYEIRQHGKRVDPMSYYEE